MLFCGCGGSGGGRAAPSLPDAAAAPASNNVTLSLPADSNGSMVAEISDALIVGSLSTSITFVPVTIAMNSSSLTASAARSIPFAASAAPNGAKVDGLGAASNGAAFVWPDGPGAREMLRPVLQSLVQVGTRRDGARVTTSLPSTVGSQATFWVQSFLPGVAGVTFEQVPETLAVQTAHANVWVQSSLTSLLGNQSALNAIASNIEGAIASDAAHFGSATWDGSAASLLTRYATCDANGNRDGGSSPMWIVPSDPHVNFVYVAPSEIGVGGYMDADSLMPENVIRCTQAQNGTYHSNQAPTIVLAYYGDERGLDYVLREDSIVHPAHEYQHLINIVHHAILQAQPRYEDALLNEGLSMLAQDFAIDAATGGTEQLDGENVLRTSDYLSAPQNYSVAGFAGSTPSNGPPLFNCATCYSPAWLLQRYLYDHFGGDAYVRAMEAGTQTSWPEVQTATGVAPQSLLDDFAIALAASNTGGATAPQYRFSSVNLRATYTDQLGDRYTLNGPTPLGMLGPAGPQTYNVLVGAYAYVAVPGTSANASVQLSTAANGFNLNGFVVSY